MAESDTQRLFVAIWPDQEVRNRLVGIQAEFQLSDLGRLVPPEKLHVTLQFLGDVADSEVEGKQELMRAIRFEPFSMEFDCVGSWPRNEVAWVGARSPCSQLDDLVLDVRARFPVKDRKVRRFVPHVTLARKVRRKLHAEIEPLSWQVERVDLVRSILDRQGAKYESISHSGQS